MTTKCTVVEGCDELPVATYQWPWDDRGLVCAKHQVMLQQKSKQLKRQVVITPLQTMAPTPLTRDERVAFNAKVLALTAECDEAKTRGLELYRANESLQDMIRTERAKSASLEASLAVATATVEELRLAHGELERQLASENAELLRLRALVPVASVDSATAE